MANYYWVGGAGAWNGGNTANWSATSGGAGGAGLPTATDNAYLDANSGASAVTITNATCLNWDCTGFAGSFLGVAAMLVYGSITLSSGITSFAPTGSISMKSSTAGMTLTSAGNVFACTVIFVFFGSGGCTLMDSFTTSGTIGITLTGGTVDTNSQSVNVYSFASTTGNRTLTLGATVFTLRGSPWNVSSTLVLNAGTSIISLTTQGTISCTFNGGGLTYNELQFANGAGTTYYTITGSNTFSVIRSLRLQAHTIQFGAGYNNTVSSFLVNGSAGNIITINSGGSTTASTLTKAGGGTVTVNYASISYSKVFPVATWTALNSTNGPSNTNWTFGLGGTGNTFFRSNF